MKIAHFLPIASCLVGCMAPLYAQDSGAEATLFKTVLYEDEFSGDRLDSRWGMYKSASVVRDGVMVGITSQDADHPSVNTIRIDPHADLEVTVAFRFAGSKRFQVMFRDKNCKSSHAGHICHVAITDSSLTLHDGKTGIFRKDIRDKRKQKKPLDDATKRLLKTKSARFPHKLDATQWHTLTIRIQGDVMETGIDGQFFGRLQSDGIAHSTKDQVNLTTNDREVHYDHFKIKAP